MPVTREGRLEDNLQRFERAMPGALFAAASVVLARTHRIFVLFRPRGWASGGLVGSLTISPAFMQGGWMKIKVGPTKKYGWWVHFGRPPGKMPPIQAILDWVRVQKIAYEPGGGFMGTPRYTRKGTTAASQEKLELAAAWAIAKKIAREGTTPFPFLTTAFRQSEKEALRVFTKQLATNVVME